MKIGIIIHSHTGNTLSVGERLKQSLLAGGHTVQLERVAAVNEDPNSRERISLKSVPDITQYDAVIIGAPVRAFSLSPVMKAYLSQLPDMCGKKAACFVTQHFPKPWMGGSHSIKQMIHAIEQKGGKLMDTGVVNWTSKAREKQIDDVTARLCKI
jgi:menaquinone-dependent protoporphyrinogen IX oxidase